MVHTIIFKLNNYLIKYYNPIFALADLPRQISDFNFLEFPRNITLMKIIDVLEIFKTKDYTEWGLDDSLSDNDEKYNEFLNKPCSKLILHDNINKNDFNLDYTYKIFDKISRKNTIINNYNKRTHKIVDYNNEDI